MNKNTANEYNDYYSYLKISYITSITASSIFIPFTIIYVCILIPLKRKIYRCDEPSLQNIDHELNLLSDLRCIYCLISIIFLALYSVGMAFATKANKSNFIETLKPLCGFSGNCNFISIDDNTKFMTCTTDYVFIMISFIVSCLFSCVMLAA